MNDIKASKSMNESPALLTGPEEFLSQAGVGRKIVTRNLRETFFTQGSLADSVYYVHSGRVKLDVVSKAGKEATVSLLGPGDFLGEEAVAYPDTPRPTTAVAISECKALRIDREEIIRALSVDAQLLRIFVNFLLAKSMRTQADVIDQLLNSSERRLARTLLLMADLREQIPQPGMVPRITHAALANMVGTTRSRVSFFLNRFRSQGFIEYRGSIRVHRSLSSVLLQEPSTHSRACRTDPVSER